VAPEIDWRTDEQSAAFAAIRAGGGWGADRLEPFERAFGHAGKERATSVVRMPLLVASMRVRPQRPRTTSGVSGGKGPLAIASRRRTVA